MTLNYFIADVFTDQLFSGAQIAVFPYADKLKDEQMALIAREMNLSETVFVSNPSENNSSRTMRIFSPLGEIDFAGHPIIATAFILGSCGDIKLNDGINSFTFTQNVGEIEVNITADKGRSVLYSLLVKYLLSSIDLLPLLMNWQSCFLSALITLIIKSMRPDWCRVVFPI